MTEEYPNINDPVEVFVPQTANDFNLVTSMLRSANIPFFTDVPIITAGSEAGKLFVARKDADDVRALVAFIQKSEKTDKPQTPKAASSAFDDFSEQGPGASAPNSPGFYGPGTDESVSVSRSLLKRGLLIAAVLILLALIVAAGIIFSDSDPANVEKLNNWLQGNKQSAATVSQKSTAAKATPQPPAAPQNPQTDRERLIAAAYSYQGIPYKFGGKTTAALDCSGFTKLAYAKAGVELPDGSFNQAQGEKPLHDESELQPGDLIFYRFKPGGGVTHITMYRGAGWVIGTGTPGQAHKVSIYPFADDLAHKDWTLSFRHIPLPDEK